MKARILSSFFLTLAVAVAPAITPEQAGSTAVAFLRLVKPNVDPAEISRMYVNTHPDVRTTWLVTFPHYGVDIDDATGAVIGYEDIALYGRATGGPESRGVVQSGHPFYASASELVGRARSVLALVGWTHGSALRHRPFPNPDRAGNVYRGPITINFDDSPGGYPNPGVGNTVTVALDSLTGEAITIDRRIGFRYASPRVNITRQQAIAAAAPIVALGNSPQVLGPLFQEASHGSPTAAGRSLADSKICPLVYIVRGVEVDVIVSTDTGEVLAHYSHATASSVPPARGESQRKPGTSAPILGKIEKANGSRSPWLIVILIAIPIATGGVAGVLLLSRRAAK